MAREEELRSGCSNSLRTRSERAEVVLETRPLVGTPIKTVDIKILANNTNSI